MIDASKITTPDLCAWERGTGSERLDDGDECSDMTRTMMSLKKLKTNHTTKSARFRSEAGTVGRPIHCMC